MVLCTYRVRTGEQRKLNYPARPLLLLCIYKVGTGQHHIPCWFCVIKEKKKFFLTPCMPHYCVIKDVHYLHYITVLLVFLSSSAQAFTAVHLRAVRLFSIPACSLRAADVLDKQAC